MNWLMKYPRLWGTITFILFFEIGLFIAWQNHQITTKREETECMKILDNMKQNAEQVTIQTYNALLTLALTVDQDGVPQDFEKIAARIKESNKVMDVLELLPQGVVEYIYPLSGNEQAYHLNIFNDSVRKREALKSIDESTIYFAGPLELKKGGRGVIARLPVFKSDKFWGFSSVVIGFPDLLDYLGFNDAYLDEFYMQFSKVNPLTGSEEFFLPIDDHYLLKYSSSVSLPLGDWKFYITRKGSLDYGAIVIIILTFVLSVLGGMLVYQLLRTPQRLQKLVAQKSGELVVSERRFRLLFENASDGIMIFDEGGRLLDVNPRMKVLTGYSTEQLRQMKTSDLVREEDFLFFQNIMDRLKKDKYLLYERYLLKSDHKLLEVEISAVKLPNGNYQGIVRDVSERKRNEALLKQAEEQFYQDVIAAIEKEKQKFGQKLHDGLSQLLTAVSMQVNMLTAEIGDEQRELLAICHNIRELSNHAVAEARSISYHLMSSSLENNGLLIALEEMGHQFRASSHVTILVALSGVRESDFDGLTKLNLYRITQELLIVMLDDEFVREVFVSLSKKDGIIELQVSGRGVVSSAATFEPGNVKYRVQLIHGEFSWGLEEDAFTFTIRLPASVESVVSV